MLSLAAPAWAAGSAAGAAAAASDPAASSAAPSAASEPGVSKTASPSDASKDKSQDQGGRKDAGKVVIRYDEDGFLMDGGLIDDLDDAEAFEGETGEGTPSNASKPAEAQKKAGIEEEEEQFEGAFPESEDELDFSDLLDRDPDNLLLEYFERELNDGKLVSSGSPLWRMAKTPRKNNLSGTDLAIYEALLPGIKKIASGEVSSTMIDVPYSLLASNYSHLFSEEELGFEPGTTCELRDGEIVFADGMRDRVYAAMDEQVPLQFKIEDVFFSLLADCPYDLYWCAKNVKYVGDGLSYNAVMRDGVLYTSFHYTDESCYTFKFRTSPEYRAFASDEYHADTERTSAAANAAASAKEIVRQARNLSDYDKLVFYRNEICSRVTYDDAASSAGTIAAYGSGGPWQLINVFDSDPSTNVVCEGYSKAFQYLFDLTSFDSSGLDCISPTGYLGGTELHMWNVVTMENGERYLVDVTNCDEDTVGYPDQLFLRGFTGGSADSGYTFKVGDRSVGYAYDRDCTDLYRMDELTLSGSDYLAVKVPVTGVTLNPAAVSITAGNSVTLGAEVLPSDATSKGVIFTSGDPRIATVTQGGKVTGIRGGTTTVTVKTKEGQYPAYCEVTVTELPLQGISLNTASMTLDRGKTRTLTLTLTPAEAPLAASGSITWESSNTKVVSVTGSSDGKSASVKAVSGGTADITVTVKDFLGNTKTASCRVTVPASLSSVKLDKTSLVLPEGNSVTVKLTLSPEDAALASSGAITWKSSNGTAVSVTPAAGGMSAVVKAQSAGSATVTATVKDHYGNTKTASCKVTAAKALSSVKLDASSFTLGEGKTRTLKLTLSPSAVSLPSAGAFSWKSSNGKVLSVTASKDGRSATVKAVSAGSAFVTVTVKDLLGNTKTASCKVTAAKPLSSVKLDRTSLDISTGKSQTVKITLSPATASLAASGAVTWKSGNAKIVSVTPENGGKSAAVKALSIGSTDITVTVKDLLGNTKTASCKVSVHPLNGWGTDGTKKYYYVNGAAAKGWKVISGAYYYFDPSTGAMTTGERIIDNIPCWFDQRSGKGLNNSWRTIGGKDYWYEKGQRQGTRYDKKGVIGNGTVRGREIYDPVSKAWYWLDAVYNGAKAVSKEVWMPYIYQNETVKTNGKWVRYRADGSMVKGWFENEKGRYYYHQTTGAMLKGIQWIDGRSWRFHEVTGILVR